MRVARLFFTVYLAVVLAISLAAQQTVPAGPGAQPVVSRDSQSLSLLAQCKAAMGVPSNPPDIYAEGTITPANPNSPSSSVVLKSKGTDRVRNEIGLSGAQQVHVVNSGRGFSLISGQKKHLASHATSYFRPEHLSAFACAIDVARSNVSISYVGLENVGAVAVHHILFQAASPDPLEQLISEFHVYLDTKTLRVVKTANWAFSPDAIENRSLWETYYDNYQPVGGMQVPMRLRHFLAGLPLDDWTFSKVSTDVAVLDSDFN